MFKKFLKLFVPPVWYRFKNTFKQHASGWDGNYPDWETASQLCKGYDDTIIFEKVKSALISVKSGKAVYERDSVVFDHIEYSWPLLSCLLKIASENNNRLDILDFGGSLGTSYYQNRHFMKALTLNWHIVEQPHFVEFGKREFEDDRLKFAYTIEEVLEHQPIHVLLLSSVLPYLENPFEWITKFSDLPIKYILVDRTGFTNTGNDVLSIQTVPESIYAASYPCWFFNESTFAGRFKGYRVVADFNSQFDYPVNLNKGTGYWKGFLLERI